jgi:hypothetical protein
MNIKKWNPVFHFFYVTSFCISIELYGRRTHQRLNSYGLYQSVGWVATQFEKQAVKLHLSKLIL